MEPITAVLLGIIAIAAISCAASLAQIADGFTEATKAKPLTLTYSPDAALQQAMNIGGHIRAIKLYRELSGSTLKDAKDYVEKAVEEGRIIRPK